MMLFIRYLIRIPEKIPDEIMRKIQIQSNLSDVLNILVKYKLCNRINPNSSKVGVSTHRLLEKQIKSCLFENNNSEEQVIKKYIINIQEELLSKLTEHQSMDGKKLDLFYSYIRYILLKLKIETDKIGDPYDKLSAYERYVNFNSTQSLVDGLKSFNIFKNLYKGDHEKTSNQLNNIGNIYNYMKHE
jgi:hypothetical protein